MANISLSYYSTNNHITYLYHVIQYCYMLQQGIYAFHSVTSDKHDGVDLCQRTRQSYFNQLMHMTQAEDVQPNEFYAHPFWQQCATNRIHAELRSFIHHWFIDQNTPVQLIARHAVLAKIHHALAPGQLGILSAKLSDEIQSELANRIDEDDSSAAYPSSTQITSNSHSTLQTDDYREYLLEKFQLAQQQYTTQEQLEKWCKQQAHATIEFFATIGSIIPVSILEILFKTMAVDVNTCSQFICSRDIMLSQRGSNAISHEIDQVNMYHSRVAKRADAIVCSYALRLIMGSNYGSLISQQGLAFILSLSDKIDFKARFNDLDDLSRRSPWTHFDDAGKNATVLLCYYAKNNLNTDALLSDINPGCAWTMSTLRHIFMIHVFTLIHQDHNKNIKLAQLYTELPVLKVYKQLLTHEQISFNTTTSLQQLYKLASYRLHYAAIELLLYLGIPYPNDECKSTSGREHVFAKSLIDWLSSQGRGMLICFYTPINEEYKYKSGDDRYERRGNAYFTKYPHNYGILARFYLLEYLHAPHSHHYLNDVAEFCRYQHEATNEREPGIKYHTQSNPQFVTIMAELILGKLFLLSNQQLEKMHKDLYTSFNKPGKPMDYSGSDKKIILALLAEPLLLDQVCAFQDDFVRNKIKDAGQFTKEYHTLLRAICYKHILMTKYGLENYSPSTELSHESGTGICCRISNETEITEIYALISQIRNGDINPSTLDASSSATVASDSSAASSTVSSSDALQTTSDSWQRLALHAYDEFKQLYRPFIKSKADTYTPAKHSKATNTMFSQDDDISLNVYYACFTNELEPIRHAWAINHGKVWELFPHLLRQFDNAATLFEKLLSSDNITIPTDIKDKMDLALRQADLKPANQSVMFTVGENTILDDETFEL